MLQGIGSKTLITIEIVYFAIAFTGAFVLKANSSFGKDEIFENYGQDLDESLSFLDEFVFEVKETDAKRDSSKETDTITEKKRNVKRSAPDVTVPRYMLDIYELLADRRHHVKFDRARSYHSSNIVADSSCVSDFKELKGRALFPLVFNVSHFSLSEIVLFSQLRIQVVYQENTRHVDSKTITIYSCHDSSIVLASKSFNPIEKNLLTLNVTAAVRKATISNNKQLQFQISIPEEFLHLLLLDAESVEGPNLLVLSKNYHEKEQKEDMILKRMRRSFEESISKFPSPMKSVRNVFNQTKADSISRNPRKKRSEEDDEEAEEQTNYIVEELGRIRKGKLKRKKNPCRRKRLHVNFAAINYDQWIIAPPTYEAFECTGRCSFPMSAHLAPTKHAIIQTLMHSLEPKQVSRACCVPIKLAPMSIMYVEDDGTITLEYEYEDMVVVECGCR